MQRDRLIAAQHLTQLGVEVDRWRKVLAQIRDDTPSVPWHARCLVNVSVDGLDDLSKAVNEAAKVTDRDTWADMQARLG